MDNAHLPAGWTKAVVGDYLYLKNGFAFKSNDYTAASDNTFPVIRISDLDGKTATDSNAVHVLEGAPGFEVRNGDLLIAMSGATTGKVGVYQGKEPAYQNQRVGNLKLHSEVSGSNGYKNYLVHFLSADILKIAYGGAQPNISGKAIEEMEILLPPLAEQKVIADKLDTLLAQVETTKARLERIPEILNSFRQSVLSTAVTGKLTEDWDATKLPVKDLCIAGFDGPFGSKLKSSDYSDSGIRVARLENIGHLHFDNSKKTYISEAKYSSLIKNTLENGDVLFSSFVDETVNVCVFNNNDEKFINKADCFCLRPRTSSVSSQFLSYVLASRTSYEQIKNQVQGVTRPRINLSILKGLTFNIPPIEQQLEIVLKVEELFAFADRIEQAAQAAQSRVNLLTQSILARAFRGELTADWRAANPDLISGDNSAEALLAKIKADRAKLSKKNKIKA
jgi:type I restriction enzyme S subunit